MDAVPPGGTLITRWSRNLTIFDPAQGRLRQLAHQPTLHGWFDPAATAGAHIWISGVNPVTLRPAVAVSHDGGATWIERDLPGTAAASPATLPNGYLSFSGQPVILIAGAGATAYAAFWDGSTQPPAEDRIAGTEDLGWLRTYRTTDGGLTWQAVAAGSTTPSFGSGWLTADGRIVVWLPDRTVDGEVVDLFAVSSDGRKYETAAPPGLPRNLTSLDGTTGHSDDATYVSDDGWTWREVRPE